MPIRFPCAHCGKPLAIGTRKAGRQITCPLCHGELTVPAAEPTPAPAPDAAPAALAEVPWYVEAQGLITAAPPAPPPAEAPRLGVLVQDRDRSMEKPAGWKVVTKRQPTKEELDSMLFGWKVGKHVKSNAIVYCRGEQTLGVGAGQMARVDSSRIAVWKAGEAKLDLKGSVVASEALFPFADGLIAAAEAGATAAIQPGGSLRDGEVIKAADERGLAMVFTGSRHFKH